MTNKFTIESALGYFPHTSISSIGGKRLYVGSCLLCGGTDRAGIYEDDQGRVMYFCRQGRANHPDLHPWFFDHIVFLATGKWPEGSFIPDPNAPREEYKKPERLPAPTWSALAEFPVFASIDDVISYSKNSDEALRYFGGYGINHQTIDRFKLGFAHNVPFCSLPVGFTIPNISWGPDGKFALRSMQIRRDDKACRDIMMARSPEWLKQELDKLSVRWKKAGKETEPTLDDLFAVLYPKYTGITNSQPGIWGDDLVSLPNGERIGPWLPYIFVTEDAKSAMVLRQDGWPAVAYWKRKDWTEWLPETFQRVANVYIIADRDEKENNAGAGMFTAKMIEERIRAGAKSNTRIILPPGHHNDVADLVRAESFDSMRNWIDSKVPGLQPYLG